MKQIIKKIPGAVRVYTFCDLFLKAYFPTFHAKVAYRISYGKRCNLKDPQTLSEKLLWLSLHTYRNNRKIMNLCDKYLVRDYLNEHGLEQYLNELIYVFKDIDEISYDSLPDQFALKISQGCATNIFCQDKASFSKEKFLSVLKEWKSGQKLYDKVMADVGGITRKELPKYYICEKFLHEKDKQSPTDYKIYCFNGEPKAVLVISDRFENKSGMFMSPTWEVLGELSGVYKKPKEVYPKPQSLNDMIEVAKILSKEFPFVRVDMYDIEGKAVFGEMTFFPSGCVHLQETMIDGKTMGELLQLPIDK